MDKHVVFLALARPPMFLGVTQGFFMLNVLLHLALNIGMGTFLGWLSLAVCHVLGLLCCRISPYFFYLIAGYLKYRTQARNFDYFNCIVIDPR